MSQYVAWSAALSLRPAILLGRHICWCSGVLFSAFLGYVPVFLGALWVKLASLLFLTFSSIEVVLLYIFESDSMLSSEHLKAWKSTRPLASAFLRMSLSRL